MSDDYFVGIDLGTTYSCIGTYKNGKVEIITNENGGRTTPSYVAFTESERYIGETAKNQLASNLSNTIFNVKRLIGRKFDDDTILADLQHYPYKIIQDENKKLLIEVNYLNEIKHFKPEEISSMVLQKLKQDAERYLGHEIKKAVITVPAYFNDSQRQSTKDAGTIAGLEVMRIINEPTAAAIAYNIQNIKDSNERYILVFDLGGGTLDVTILCSTDGILEVKSTSGDTHLGGEDFDNKVVDYCLMDFARRTFRPKTILVGDENKILNKLCNITVNTELYKKSEFELNQLSEKIDDSKIKSYIKEVAYAKSKITEIMNNTKLIGRLKKQCEIAKKVLTENNSTTITIDSFYFDANNATCYDLKINLTRDIFERLCNSEFNRCLEPVNRALQDAKIPKEMIQDVVLIGGSTRVPKIKQILSNMFGADKLRNDINPDEAVAYGAVIQAGILCNVEDSQIRDLVLIDVTSLTLGIETAGGIMCPLIKRNTPLPYEKEEIFSTSCDNQPGVTIKIFEGERELTKDNNSLGTFELDGIPPMPKGMPRIKVKFSIDTNGIMCVSAFDETSGKSNNITIKNDKGRLSNEEIAKMIEDAQKYAEQDKIIKEGIESRINLDSYISNTKLTIEGEQFKLLMGEEIYQSIFDKLNDGLNWLDYNESCSKSEYDEFKQNLEYEITPFIQEYISKKNSI